MVEKKIITVEVAYARPDSQRILAVSVPLGTTAIDAVKKSGIKQEFEEIDLDQIDIGIYGKVVSSDTVLNEHDRIEIYRPLIADPKEVRKQRAAAKQNENKGR